MRLDVASLQNFLSDPFHYHLENKEGLLIATESKTKEFHCITPETLQELTEIAKASDFAQAVLEKIRLSQTGSIPPSLINRVLANTKGEKLSLAPLLSSETAKASVSPSVFPSSFIEKCNRWCEEVIGKDEYEDRIVAIHRLMLVLQDGEEKKTKKWEIADLNLSTLPYSLISELIEKDICPVIYCNPNGVLTLKLWRSVNWNPQNKLHEATDGDCFACESESEYRFFMQNHIRHFHYSIGNVRSHVRHKLLCMEIPGAKKVSSEEREAALAILNPFFNRILASYKEGVEKVHLDSKKLTGKSIEAFYDSKEKRLIVCYSKGDSTFEFHINGVPADAPFEDVIIDFLADMKSFIKKDVFPLKSIVKNFKYLDKEISLKLTAAFNPSQAISALENIHSMRNIGVSIDYDAVVPQISLYSDSSMISHCVINFLHYLLEKAEKKDIEETLPQLFKILPLETQELFLIALESIITNKIDYEKVKIDKKDVKSLPVKELQTLLFHIYKNFDLHAYPYLGSLNASKIIEIIFTMQDPIGIYNFISSPYYQKAYENNSAISPLNLIKKAIDKSLLCMQTMLDNAPNLSQQIHQSWEEFDEIRKVYYNSSLLHLILNLKLPRVVALEYKLNALKSLISSGFDLNARIYNNSGLPSTFFIEAYKQSLSKHLSEDERAVNQAIFEFCLQNGAKIDDSLAQWMKDELATSDRFAPYLIEQGFATAEEVALLCRASSIIEGSAEDYLKRLYSRMGELKHLKNALVTNFHLIDYEQIKEFTILKKAVKTFLKENTENVSLKELYEEFSLIYDEIVTTDYLLRELREISREFRTLVRDPSESKPSKPLSNRLLRALSLWNTADITDSRILPHHLSYMTETARKMEWMKVRNKILTYIQTTRRDDLWDKYHITALHGTKLTPMMLKAEALYPKGMMMDEKEGAIVPFSGELCGSEYSHNKTTISAATLMQGWDFDGVDERTIIFNQATTALCAIAYAEQIKAVGSGADYEAYFNEKSTKERVSWKRLTELSALRNPHTSDLARFRTDILRLRAAGHDEFLNPLRKEVELALTNSDELEKEVLKTIELALNIKIRFSLTEKDLQLISKPIPIVWASTSIPCKTYDGYQEVLIEGVAHFRKDIQAAFTSSDNLKIVSDLLTPLGIRVYDYNILKALETDNMIRVAARKNHQKGIGTKDESENFISNLNYFLNSEILPLYSIPLNPIPSYRTQSGETKIVESPLFGIGVHDYADYRKKVESGEILPRTFHGKMHASRVTIAALIFSFIRIDADSNSEIPTGMLAMTAAAHDCARQDEGIDYWDFASAEVLGSYLTSMSIPEEIVNECKFAISNKDPIDGHFTSTLQSIVHDADVIEIMRVLPDPLAQFDKSHLTVQRLEEDGKIPTGTIDELVKEWHTFLTATEKEELKLFMEQKSHDYFGDVLRILKSLNLPFIHKYVWFLLLSYHTTDLNPEILRILGTTKEP